MNCKKKPADDGHHQRGRAYAQKGEISYEV